tara:strand:+ start:25 stop:663 length:639 start_codon:yes stop_codon:yes gene_type:complete
MDGASIENPSSDRHTFHKRYFKWLISAGGLVLVLALVNVYFLDIDIIRNGAILSACSVSYLLLVYFIRKLWVKEILVALVYSVGIYLAPMSKIDSVTYLDILLILQLSGVAFLNLLIFSFYDRKSDLEDGFNSLVLRLGDHRSRILIIVTALLVLLCCVTLGLNEPIQLLYTLMDLILFLIFLLPTFFTQSTLYRVIGDGIFYLPGFFLLLA